MKNVIISCGLVFLMIISTLILFTIYGQNTRQNELDEALSAAVEQTLENMKINKSYSVDTTKEFIADFQQNLIVSIESDSELKVEILSVDIEKGLLDVYVTETFTQPNGTTNTATCRKTVVLEEYVQAEPNYYIIKFLAEKENNSGEFADFKTYSICENNAVIVPSSVPKQDGYTFVGWSLTKPEESNDFSPETIVFDAENQLVADNNLTFYAVFKEAK